MAHIQSIELLAAINAQRIARGFMSINQMLERLSSGKNIVLDPFSTLISDGVEIGESNTFYPNVILEAMHGGTITLGNSNLFYPSSFLLADQGRITVGDSNEFGSGGLQIKANMPTSSIQIGNNGRYMNGAEIMGQCVLGSGSQILGAISVQNCTLEAGESYKGSQPETRAALLKGFGLARNLTVKQGEVINGQGKFEQSAIEQQAAYHPKKI